jgi:hypothetical protein
MRDALFIEIIAEADNNERGCEWIMVIIWYYASWNKIYIGQQERRAMVPSEIVRL